VSDTDADTVPDSYYGVDNCRYDPNPDPPELSYPPICDEQIRLLVVD